MASRRTAGAGTVRTLGIFERRVGSSQQRIEVGEVDAGQIFRVVTTVAAPFRIHGDGAPHCAGCLRLGRAGRRDVRRLSQSADSLCGQRPVCRLRSDAPASPRNVADAGDFVGGCANIPRGIMDDEVFEIDEFAVDPQRGASVGEVGSFDPTRPTGERAVRSSRRACAVPGWKAGRIRAVMSTFARL